MRLLLLICGLIPCIYCGAQKPKPTALIHVNIVDVEAGELWMDRTVVIKEGIIQDIHPSTGNEHLSGYSVINAHAKYLIPGLIDSHVHLHNFFKENRQHFLQVPFNVMLYYGLTGFREASGSIYTREFVQLRDSVVEGKLLAPSLYVSGITSPTNLKKLNVSTYPELVSRFSQMKVDGIKVKFTTLQETKEIIDAAHKLHLPVYGHTANVWTADSTNVLGDFTAEIVDYGIDGVMHTGGYPPVRNSKIPTPPPSDQWEASWLYMDAMWLFADTAQEHLLISNMIRHKVWLEPTLTVEQIVSSRQQYEHDPGLKFIFSSYDEYFTGFPSLTLSQMDTALMAFRRKQEFTKKFHDAGGLVLAGTDHLFGSTLHKEMELLVQAGLSPAEALKAATFNNAMALGWLRERGTISVGKKASLVLLDKNPLKDIRNSRTIQMVILDGQVLDRKKVDQLKKEAEEMVAAIQPASK